MRRTYQTAEDRSCAVFRRTLPPPFPQLQEQLLRKFNGSFSLMTVEPWPPQIQSKLCDHVFFMMYTRPVPFFFPGEAEGDHPPAPRRVHGRAGRRCSPRGRFRRLVLPREAPHPGALQALRRRAQGVPRRKVCHECSMVVLLMPSSPPPHFQTTMGIIFIFFVGCCDLGLELDLPWVTAFHGICFLGFLADYRGNTAGSSLFFWNVSGRLCRQPPFFLYLRAAVVGSLRHRRPIFVLFFSWFS